MNFVKNIQFTSIIDMKVWELEKFTDNRGDIWTIYDREYMDDIFVADKVSISQLGVLRGLHGDSGTAKLITCLNGEFQLSVVDLREYSSSYGSVETLLVKANEPKIVYVPAGCLNGHLALTDNCIFYYKWTKKYEGPEKQLTIAWDSDRLNIPWLIVNPILSKRDKDAKFFNGEKL